MKLENILFIQLCFLYAGYSTGVKRCEDLVDVCHLYEQHCDDWPGMDLECPKTCGLCQECSEMEGFFELGENCYKIIRDQLVTWQDAKDKCSSEGLSLVSKPDDPISLRKYIVDNYARMGSGTANVWLDARGDRSYTMYRWEQDNSSLSFTDPLWYSSEPSPGEERGDGCLCMIGAKHHMGLEPNSPYAGCICHGPGLPAYPLCE